MSKVILTGLRANNDLHIGNYLGALLPIIDMAKKHSGEYQINLFIPDLHSFTTPIDHDQLYSQIIQNVRVYIAAGLPTNNSDVFVYRQSHVPAHSELAWILNCFTSLGQLNRMTQFKDKAKIQDYDHALRTLRDYIQTGNVNPQQLRSYVEILWAANSQEASATAGLYTYPVLMAADILLYDATYVPVGDDQTQHLEFTRDIAERMNNRFRDLFTVPAAVPKQHEFFGKDQGLRIKDLADPTKKMSKSDETGKGVIFMSDSPEAAAKKIMSATTDSFGDIKYDLKERPGVSNLLQILALLSGRDLKDVIAEYEGQTMYGDLKKATAEVVGKFLTDFQAKLATVDEQAVLAKLEKDEAAMREQANKTLHKVQQAVGLRPKS